jgi:hypothetical protein
MSGTATPNLGLEYLYSSQEEPEVKINAAWDAIDAAVGAGVGIEVSESGDSPAGNVLGARRIKFVGATVTEETDSVAVVTIDTSSESGGSPIEVTDGTTSVTDVTLITVMGATVSEASAGHAVIELETPSEIASGGGGNVTPDSHPASPSAMNDEFEETEVDMSTWGWVNQNGATAVTANGSLVMTGELTNTSTRGMEMLLQDLPGEDATFLIKIAFAVATSNNGGGLCLRESATGKLMRFGSAFFGSPYFDVSSYTNPSTNNAAIDQYAWPYWVLYGLTEWLYFQIEISGTSILLSVSHTGLPGSFHLVTTVAFTTPFTTAPDQIGYFVESFSAASQAAVFSDYFRRTA